jgi:lactate dehydrogenase-like 2-hydroxyacid dehydrogenase
MKIAVYSTKQYDKKYLQHVNDAYGFELEFFDFLLTEKPPKPPTVVKRCASSSTMTAAARCWKS